MGTRGGVEEEVSEVWSCVFFNNPQKTIVPLSSVDKILRLCFTAENAEDIAGAEFSLFSFKFSAPAMSSAASAVKSAYQHSSGALPKT